ncbi:Putative disease resistance protein RGA3 [Linum perenne]
MASVVLTPLARQVFLTLRKSLIDGMLELWISNKQLDDLKETVSSIQAVLLDAQEQQINRDDVRQWLQRLSNVMYHADDILDDFWAEAARLRSATAVDDFDRDPDPFCLRFIVSLAKQRLYAHEMDREIKAVKKELDELYKEKAKLDLENPTDHDQDSDGDGDEQPLISGLRSSYGYIQVVGRDDDLEKVKRRLLEFEDDGKVVSVVPIVGVGGIGKTTLAELLYQHESINQHFDLKLWLNVSDSIDVEWVVRKILESTTQQKQGVVELHDQSRRMLQRSIGGKRLLLVLDDVRQHQHLAAAGEQWSLLLDNLKLAAGTGSKVIVTTRSQDVGDSTGGDIYILPGLEYSKGRDLFNQLALNGREEDARDSRVRKVVGDLVKISDGNPLAIRVIGSLLAAKESKTEWLAFADRYCGQILKTGGPNDIHSTLMLSYQLLPSDLKQCFEYCSLFPIDSTVEVQTLIHLWIAQGFIDTTKEEDEQQSIEDVGRSYLVNLMQRSFVQGEKDEFGHVKTFKVHRLMHDLAKLVAGNKIKTVESKQGDEDQELYINEEVRHLSFSTHLDASAELPSGVIRAKSLRTVFLANQELRPSINVRHRGSILKFFSSSFSRLRALDAHNSGIKRVPTSIRHLKVLRYLDLSENDDIQLLPDSITELLNLQVLKLSYCELLKQLPSDIGRLVNLRHLYCEGCWNLSHMPRSIGELTSLVTLTWFVLPKESFFVSPQLEVAFMILGVDEWNNELGRAAGLSELGSLNCLRGRLEIRNLGAYMKNNIDGLKSAASFLSDKKGLQSLSLCWDTSLDEDSLDEDEEWPLYYCLEPPQEITELELCEYGGKKIPTCLFSLNNNLISLQIQDCPRCESLPSLEEFPNLKFLRVESLPNLHYIDCTGLQSLRELYIFKCPELKEWCKDRVFAATNTIPEFKCLSRLEIRDCPLLEQMPLFPNLEDKLFLENAGLTPLWQTMKIDQKKMKIITTAPSSSSSSTLSKLKALWISLIDHPDIISKDLLQALTSLQELRIDCCTNIKFLQSEMRGLTSLQELNIRRCPQLKQRCAGNKAVDWPNISHVPNITIDEKTIQLGGLYRLSEEESAAMVANFSFIHPLSRITSLTVENLEHESKEWMLNLVTLKELNIVNCPRFASQSHLVDYLPSRPVVNRH